MSARPVNGSVRNGNHGLDECQVSQAGSGLNNDERAALAELARGSIRQRIPMREAERLLELGLAELNFGHLELTAAGRNALFALRVQ